MDKHLEILAREHLEAKFLKINAEKSPYLAEKLRIFMLPTLALVHKGKVTGYVVGFDELGGTEDFPTEILETRLVLGGALAEEKLSGHRQSKQTAATSSSTLIASHPFSPLLLLTNLLPLTPLLHPSLFLTPRVPQFMMTTRIDGGPT
ncbi:unnamed protein product [Closterium sp. NIES-54]